MNIIPENLWKEIEKLIPKKKSKIGRPESDIKNILNGIFYVMKTGIQWQLMPKEFGPASTIHSRFMKLIRLGIFEKIMTKAREFYLKNNETNWYATDTSSSKSPLAIRWAGKNPTDRGKSGIKKSIIVDRNGAPLAITVGPANKHDSKFFYDTFNSKFYNNDGLKIMTADSAYDDIKIKNLCKDNNFVLLAATNPRRKKNSSKLFKPKHRWIVERTISWLNNYRGIKTCWAKTPEAYLAFCLFASAIRLFNMAGVFV